MGWRKALGYDMQRRRYWALGGGSGAWRVYVEEQEGGLWGWYEGTHDTHESSQCQLLLHTASLALVALQSVCSSIPPVNQCTKD